MINKLKAFFAPEPEHDSRDDIEHKLRKASAGLLLEVAKADLSLEPQELAKIQSLITSGFELSTDEADELVDLLDKEDISIHPLTSTINDHYEYTQKVALMQHLWSVAFADGELSKYEDATIRKIADLLYIRHADFIRTKHTQQDKP